MKIIIGILHSIYVAVAVPFALLMLFIGTILPTQNKFGAWIGDSAISILDSI